MKKPNFPLLFVLGALLLLAVFLASLLLGETRLGVDIVAKLFSSEPSMERNVLLFARLPRALAALFSGAALAVSGAVLQKLFANPLASPGILGVNASAGFGVTLAAALGVVGGLGTSLFAFAFSLACLLLLHLFAAKKGASKTTVLLFGVAASSLFSAMSESLSVMDEDVSMLSASFRLGGFSSVSYRTLIPASILILACLVALLCLVRELDVLSLGEESAQSLGLSVRLFRGIFLSLAALAAASAVSFSGLLGFVGLVTPHIVRRLVGDAGARLLPLCALFGAGFVGLCDLIARLLFAPFELPVGILLSFFGVPLFVFLLVRSKKGARHA